MRRRRRCGQWVEHEGENKTIEDEVEIKGGSRRRRRGSLRGGDLGKGTSKKGDEVERGRGKRGRREYEGTVDEGDGLRKRRHGAEGTWGPDTGSGMERRQDRAKMRWSAEIEGRATERSRVKTTGE